MKKIIIFTLLISSVLVGKAQNSKTTSSNSVPKTETSDPDNLASQFFSQVMGVAISATSNTKMYQFIYDWIGTPYRFGGNTKKGIDCSGFAKTMYDKVFNTTLLRNSRDIFSMTNPLSKEELKVGDLVFFKIKSRSITHVGVYLGDNRFAHASTSKGVVISDLDEPYYSRYFYKGGRIVESLNEE
ncbi:NLP/P60 protein [Pseudopedobacter saltans DSM 12145]|uniref:NLP/P60 protein n=1 Tax=Pseudopedobacter saltans (strain ATCC 51119 / DSM 12145 / JCM 21818 / CCUG 39354 / LMG 10337 / NBRC 100064 / NCIMB 13643) TaxID=762903 RepID=F0SAN7_PSESL|nr:NlpC/P60 family protein [Pseudopedobacter saltans]ADY53658.1 NLP/P60 protein [Pseudopedobacter saltans DSM 12145]